jgi:hypothetical protein
VGSLEAPMAAEVWFGRGLKKLLLIRFEPSPEQFQQKYRLWGLERNTGVLRSAQNDNFYSRAEQKTPKKCNWLAN